MKLLLPLLLLTSAMGASTSAGASTISAPGYWHTDGALILDSANNPVRIAAVNWYGFETTEEAPGGLNVQDYHTILNTIKSNGYNAIRLPFSSQMVESPAIPGIGYYGASGPINTDLAGLTSLQIMDKIIAAAGTLGLRVILDNHRSEAGSSAEANGLWYTSQYPETSWIYDWTFLAQRYLNNPTVIGMDLRNEPHSVGSGGACWGCGSLATDWRLAASRAGNAVLAINPKLLIFVEGANCFAGGCTWWGGDLAGAASYPVTLDVPNRLVYSPHEYGPNLYVQGWFNSTTTPARLQAIWYANWAYLSLRNENPVWIGEFGTTNNASDIQDTTPGSQGQWFESLTAYLAANPNLSWGYWALNGDDHYGLLDSNYDSAPASALKQQMLAGIQATAPAVPGFGVSASVPALNVTQGKSASVTITVGDSGGFNGTVGFYTVGLPAGATATFSPSTTKTSTVLTITAAASTAPGNYSIRAIGYSYSIPGNAQAPIELTVSAPAVPSFTLSSGASALTLTQGKTATDTVTITPSGGFAGSVSLAASGVPAGVIAAFGTNPAAATSAVTFTAASTAAPGTYPITITGTSGTISAKASIALTVAAPVASGFACHVAYSIVNQYPGGFQAGVTLYNTGTTAISNWTLTWTFANGQTIPQLWNGAVAQSGSSVTVRSLSYNGTIPAGGNYNGMGFTGTWNNTTNAVPTSFAVNYTVCK